MRVENLFRYPVKGLNAEALAVVELAPGEALPWDRAFALAQGDSGFDPAHPTFLRKSNFMCLLKNERIARLSVAFDPARLRLSITAPDGRTVSASPTSAAGRAEIGAFLTDFLGTEARGAPVFHHVPGHMFSDDRDKLVSLLNLASLRALEAKVGAARDRMRFRANLVFDGAPAWAEFDWIGRRLRIGGATLAVTKRTRRCNATQVDPITAERDADPVRELLSGFGHTDLGVLAEVVEGGRIGTGDAILLQP